MGGSTRISFGDDIGDHRLTVGSLSVDCRERQVKNRGGYTCIIRIVGIGNRCTDSAEYEWL